MLHSTIYLSIYLCIALIVHQPSLEHTDISNTTKLNPYPYMHTSSGQVLVVQGTAPDNVRRSFPCQPAEDQRHYNLAPFIPHPFLSVP